MNFLEYTFTFSELEPWRDILIAHFGEEFESFVETEDGFLAYIDESKNQDFIEEMLKNEIFNEVEINFSFQKIENKNWNEEWEKDFQPILIDDKIYIRAEFHPKIENIEYEIVIQPKMSFGTGHHSTTYLMMETMYSIDFQNKKVLDVGCGTAILAIFAKLKGAAYTEGVDIDEWSYVNSIENAERNMVEITVKKGEISLVTEKFDIILANINKNILLNDIATYCKHLNQNGILLLSGIMEKDFEDIDEVCVKNNLVFVKKEEKNQWLCIQYQK